MTAALEGGEWSAVRPGRTLLPRKTRYPGSVWTEGKSRRHRDSIPDRPARSRLLYRLSYPTHDNYVVDILKEKSNTDIRDTKVLMLLRKRAFICLIYFRVYGTLYILCTTAYRIIKITIFVIRVLPRSRLNSSRAVVQRPNPLTVHQTPKFVSFKTLQHLLHLRQSQ